MNLEKKLIAECKNGNLEEVKSLIEQGVNIHADNDLPLIWASSNGNLGVVKYLIENGANIHVYNDYPLQCAASNNHLETLKYLAENGANLHTENNYALCGAIESGHLKIVKYLVENLADINTKNDQSLILASENEQPIILNYLLSLYENKENAFKIVIKNLLYKDDLPMVKNIIDNYDLELDADFLEELKNEHPSIYDYLKLSKEIGLTKNSLSFNIKE